MKYFLDKCINYCLVVVHSSEKNEKLFGPNLSIFFSYLYFFLMTCTSVFFKMMTDYFTCATTVRPVLRNFYTL